MATNFTKIWLKLHRPQPSNHVTCLSCDYVIFPKRCISSFATPTNLLGFWVKVKGLYLHFQVTCRSSDHVLFKKRHASTNPRPRNSAGDIQHRKTHKSKTFCHLKDITIWFTSIYITLKISKLQVSNLPYCFYYICSSIVWGHCQLISKLFIQIVLCELVYDNETHIIKQKL